MDSIPVIILAAICSMAVSAQSDSCYRDLNGLLDYKIEERINSTLRQRLTTLVPELTQSVTSMVEQRIGETVNNTLNRQLGNRIAADIRSALANEPVVASFLVTIQPSRLISVIPGPRFANSVDNISLANAGVAVTSEHNLVAYRPRLSAGHGSRLGVLLFNIHGIFPCLNLTRGFPAICTRYTLDEDGFLGGRPFIEAADGGNNWRIFSTTENIVTYGIGLKGCPELNRACLPNYAAFAVSCLLPRGNCG